MCKVLKKSEKKRPFFTLFSLKTNFYGYFLVAPLSIHIIKLFDWDEIWIMKLKLHQQMSVDTQYIPTDFSKANNMHYCNNKCRNFSEWKFWNMKMNLWNIRLSESFYILKTKHISYYHLSLVTLQPWCPWPI